MKDEPECPEGCIKSIEELKGLLEQAKLEPIEFYITGYTGKVPGFLPGEIRCRLLNERSELREENKEFELYYSGRDEKRTKSLTVSSLPEVSINQSTLRFFLNYWHAYAYSLRFKEKVDV